MPFVDAIRIDLSLTVGSAAPIAIPGAHVKELALDFHTHGFSGHVVFDSPALYRADDALLSGFKGQDLIEIALSIQAAYNMPDPAPAPIALRGLVQGKSVTEKGYGQISGSDAYHRRYRVAFADLARVLWRQHFPCVLLTDASLADLIDQQKPAGMALAYDWFAMQQKHAMLSLGLDADTSSASFYDFVLWLCDSQGGVLSYDGAAHSYLISQKKPRAGQALEANALEFAGARVVVPETVRHDAAIKNATAASSATTAITQDQAVTGVRQDFLIIEHLPAAVDARVALETARLTARAPCLEVRFNTYPSVPVFPGAAWTLRADTRHLVTSWISSSDEYWVYDLSLRAEAVARDVQGEDLDQAHTAYRAELVVRLEPKSEPRVHWPAYQVPRWPMEVEGKVVSVGGGNADKTYYIYDDSDTSLTMYNVYIPLWNKEISAPYVPQGEPGHYHFPAFKHQRVLMDLFFQQAEIQRFLDYGARTQLPMDTQGNHILFGKNETSETSMRYAYEDGYSLFEVLRVMDGDHVSWQMKEGLLYLEVREDESASSTEESYDVKPEVAAGKNQLEGSISGGIGDVTASYQTGSAELGGAVGAATSEVSGALGAMESQLGGAISDTQSQIDSAAGALSSSASQITASASTASAELLAKAKG